MNRLQGTNIQLGSKKTPPDVFQYIIVGAGVSGLQSAEIISKKTSNFCVIEAQDQEGGRVDSWSIAELKESQGVSWIEKNRKRYNEVMIEAGATWVQDGHSVMKRLCKQYGIKLNVQFCQGSSIFLDKKRPYTSKQLMQSKDYGEKIKNAIAKIDYLSKLYDEKVLSAKQLSATYYKMLQQYDTKTVMEYLQENIQDPHIRGFIQNFLEHTQCISCEENSMHQVLTKNARSSDVDILKQFLGGEYGHEPSYLIEGGTFELIHKFRERIQKNINKSLNSLLKLKHQVITIDNKRPDFSMVVAINHETNQVVKFKGKTIICAIPIAVARSISFTNISQAKKYIFDNQLRTNCLKCFIITKTPFWRKFATGDGLFSYQYPINMCHDISPQDECCGIMVFFCSGKKYSEWESFFKAAEDEYMAKKNYLINLMCKFFSVKSQQKQLLFEDAIFYESTFMNNQFIRSGFQSNTRPGTFKRIIKMKDTLQSFYRNENGVIFVGSQYSKRFASYIEGAVRSARSKIYPLIGQIDPFEAEMQD